MSVTDTFEAMLDKGQDSALLRFSLGAAYLGEGKPKQAVAHLREARRVKRYILTAQLVKVSRDYNLDDIDIDQSGSQRVVRGGSWPDIP